MCKARYMYHMPTTGRETYKAWYLEKYATAPPTRFTSKTECGYHTSLVSVITSGTTEYRKWVHAKGALPGGIQPQAPSQKRECLPRESDLSAHAQKATRSMHLGTKKRMHTGSLRRIMHVILSNETGVFTRRGTAPNCNEIHTVACSSRDVPEREYDSSRSYSQGVRTHAIASGSLMLAYASCILYTWNPLTVCVFFLRLSKSSRAGYRREIYTFT